MTPTERMLTDQLLASRAEVDDARKELRAMHRRAQRAESDVALMNRQARRWKHAYERMTQIVCDAWDALPEHIREEIESPMLPSGAILPQPRDLVRGVSMLAEETRTCDVCGATGELDSRCGRCIR